MRRKKNPAAVRLGGKAKVPKGVHLLPPERRREIVKKAAAARWKKAAPVRTVSPQFLPSGQSR